MWQPDKEELIRVVAWFDPRKPLNQRIVGLKFIWHGREHLIKELDYYHHTHEGEDLIHHFSLADKGAHFKLGFKSTGLVWAVEGIYVAD